MASPVSEATNLHEAPGGCSRDRGRVMEPGLPLLSYRSSKNEEDAVDLILDRASPRLSEINESCKCSAPPEQAAQENIRPEKASNSLTTDFLRGTCLYGPSPQRVKLSPSAGKLVGRGIETDSPLGLVLFKKGFYSPKWKIE